VAIAGGATNDAGAVTAVGYPMNVDRAQGLSLTDIFRAQPPVKSNGTLSGRRPARDFDSLLHTAPIARGSSGGPLLDECGRVLGVNSFGTDSGSADAEFYFAVSDRELLPFLLANGVKPRVNGLPCRSLADLNAQEQQAAERAQLAAQAQAAQNEARIAHSCMRTDGAFADPAARMSDFVGQFGTNGVMTSLCDDSFAPALAQLGTAIGRAFTSHCLDNTVPDGDPVAPGIQASCDVVLRAPGKADQTIPMCNAPTPQGGPQPCWYLSSSTGCNSGVLFSVNRTGTTTAGETISIRCGACR